MILKDGILVSTIFEDYPVIHGFTTRATGNLGFGQRPGDPEVIENRKRLFETQSLTSRKHVQPKQLHTNRCISANEFVPGVEADATYSNSPADFLSVLTADCLPVLVYHPDGMVSAIHAGWRGLFDGVIPAALQHFAPGFVAAIGPSIGPCCYEVGEELAETFAAKFGKEVVVQGKTKPHLDLRLAARMQLQESLEELEVCELCTSCHPDLFFSYRRDGSSGRMMSWIGLA